VVRNREQVKNCAIKLHVSLYLVQNSNLTFKIIVKIATMAVYCRRNSSFIIK